MRRLSRSGIALYNDPKESRPNRQLMANGVINIYKEKGYSSHDVVAIVRRLLRTKKVGHTGTLDPQAEGVLPICVGRATKLAGYLTNEGKSYRAELILGKTTDTGDHTGTVLSHNKVSSSGDATFLSFADMDYRRIKEVIESFVGGYMQIPPMYSAIKVNGQRLYKLARAGIEVERKARPVEISRIEILADGDDRLDCNVDQLDCSAVQVVSDTHHLVSVTHQLTLDIDCGKGTYIRSLCEDIGEKLGCGGCMGNLVRTRSGVFTVKNALRLSELEQAIKHANEYANEHVNEHLNKNVINSKNLDFLIPVDEAFPSVRGITSFKSSINGHPVPISQVETEKKLSEGDYCWLYYHKKTLENQSQIDRNHVKSLIGLHIQKNGILKPEVMMHENHKSDISN